MEQNKGLPASNRGIENSQSPAAPPAKDAEPVHVAPDILVHITLPGIEPEMEEEVKARQDLNAAVHRMLILGLVLSTSVLLIGLAVSAITHRPEPTKVSDFRQVYDGLKRGSPASILSLGILMLIATPVLRVFGSLIEFISKKDWRYAAITLLVLIILTVSALVGKG